MNSDTRNRGLPGEPVAPADQQMTKGGPANIIWLDRLCDHGAPMMDLSIVVHDGDEGTRVSTMDEFNSVIHMADLEARARKMLNIIFLQAASGNALSLVVGDDDTVLTFTHGHQDPPYYASRGADESKELAMTCYVGLVHHTEFPRQYVVPFKEGLMAAQEFAETDMLPQSISWVET